MRTDWLDDAPNWCEGAPTGLSSLHYPTNRRLTSGIELAKSMFGSEIQSRSELFTTTGFYSRRICLFTNDTKENASIHLTRATLKLVGGSTRD